VIAVLNTTFAELTVIKDGVMLPDFIVSVGQTISLDVNTSGIGPVGPQGPVGTVSTSSIGQLTDVTLTNTQEGDILVYQSSQFVNLPKTSLVDGGNF